MNYVVLSEGKRDVKLVETYYLNQSGDVQITTFYGEDVSHNRLKNAESQHVRNFLEPRNPYDILAKSENGKPNLKLVFTKLAHFILGSDADLVLIFDLDGDTDDSGIVTELDERVRTNYQGQSFRIVQDEIIDTSPDQMLTENTLLRDEREVESFHILSFFSNLEQTVGITSDDTTDEEDEKLRDFVEDSTRTSPMRQIF